MADGSTQGNGSTDPRYGPGSTAAPDSGTGPGSTTSGGGPGGSTSPSLGPGSTTSGSPGSGGSTSGDGSTASSGDSTTSPAPQAPHYRLHGKELFDHPSTNRATASLFKYATGVPRSEAVQDVVHNAQLKSDEAKANAAYKAGNQKAYHQIRQQAAKQGVKLAAYSDKGRAQASKSGPKNQAQ